LRSFSQYQPHATFSTSKMMLAETCQVSIDDNRMASNENESKPPPRKRNNSSILVGRSRAGDATAFAIPSLKWMLDCGALIQGWTPKCIFLTHTHSDHVHFLSHFLVKNLEEQTAPPKVYLPRESLPFVKAHLEAYQAMIECGTDSGMDTATPIWKIDDYLHPLQPNDEFIIQQGGGNQFRVCTLQMHHRIPCVGYSIFRITHKVKDEYVGMSGKEIGQLKRGGVEITTEHEEPFLCFLGDTTAKVFEFHPEILQHHHTIVTECSFLDTTSRQRAQETTHMHWDDLQPYVASNPNIMFVLTHFSLKYSTLNIRQFFRDLQQSIYDNVHPMLIERDVEEEWARTASNQKGNEVPRCLCRICRKQ
jgi:ribonuclease Z